MVIVALFIVTFNDQHHLFSILMVAFISAKTYNINYLYILNNNIILLMTYAYCVWILKYIIVGDWQKQPTNRNYCLH